MSPVSDSIDADVRGANYRRAKIGHQHVRGCRHRNLAHRRWALLLLSRAKRKEGDHNFRSKPAGPQRRRLETTTEGRGIFCRARGWQPKSLPKSVLEQREDRHLRRCHYWRATLYFARQIRRRRRLPHVHQADLKRSDRRKPEYFARSVSHLSTINSQLSPGFLPLE